MASVGGWNGAHINPLISSSEWYQTFKREVGDLFHGIDWDLEGHDDLSSTSNFFTLDCLDKVGEISRMAKQGNLLFPSTKLPGHELQLTLHP
jgi:beta-glucosidase